MNRAGWQVTGWSRGANCRGLHGSGVIAGVTVSVSGSGSYRGSGPFHKKTKTETKTRTKTETEIKTNTNMKTKSKKSIKTIYPKNYKNYKKRFFL